MQLLTTAEAAQYLRLKERKLYELVAEGVVPCTKVTGKWLFPKEELDLWLTGNLGRPDDMQPPATMPIVGGSHDPLLEWALRESGSGLAVLSEGSEAGLERFANSAIVAAAIHLHSATRENEDANLAAIRTRPGFHDSVLVGFARREAGILTAPGNPLGIRGIRDMAAGRARVAARPEGAGAQLLLRALLFREGIDPARLNMLSPPRPTGNDVGHAIKAGRADCGIAVRAVAVATGLEFIPLLHERFDLVIRQREYFRAPVQALVGFMRSATMRSRADELGGYDLADTGAIRYAP